MNNSNHQDQGNSHPEWCDPSMCLKDPVDNSRIHCKRATRIVGPVSAVVEAVAPEGEPLRVFLNVTGEEGASLADLGEVASFLLEQQTALAAVVPLRA